MARINIEEKWWGDPRRTKLITLLGGDALKADGTMLIAIKLAQQYWIPNKELIPLKTWHGAGLNNFLFQTGLAEIKDGSVYVSGSEEYFDWWFKCQSYGKRGGLKSGKLRHEATLDPPQGTLKGGQGTPKGGQPSSSSSSSSSNSKEEEGSLLLLCSEKAKGKWFEVYRDAKWILEQSKKAECWLASNPEKRKTNMTRFFNNWLSNATDKPPKESTKGAVF